MCPRVYSSSSLFAAKDRDQGQHVVRDRKSRSGAVVLVARADGTLRTYAVAGILLRIYASFVPARTCKCMCLQGSARWRSPATPRTGWRWSAWTSTPSASSRACARSSATLTSSRWRKVKDKKPGGEKQVRSRRNNPRSRNGLPFFPIKMRRTFPPIRQEKHTQKTVFGSVRLFGKSVTRSRRSTKLSGCIKWMYHISLLTSLIYIYDPISIWN